MDIKIYDMEDVNIEDIKAGDGLVFAKHPGKLTILCKEHFSGEIYILRYWSGDMFCGINGFHETVKECVEDAVGYMGNIIRHYPADKYELRLVKIEED